MLVRKTVTVLFCDVVTSTELGERLDPESLRRVMSRYFEEMQTILERHGGTIEKFIGDEVMAVFGVPLVHEDDALRAVRAASEMRGRLERLNEELEATWGVRLQVRIGVNTGEVVAGDPNTGSTFVTGEAVVLAKRLEQAAAPGEILIGKATHPLVRDAVKAGPLESFSVKGKREPVGPWRLDLVDAELAGFARRLDAPLVGRETELAALRAAFDRAADESGPHLVTLLAAAGIGKSRLAGELLAALGDRATALTGRCLPYGDGITFWPLVEIVRAVGGDEGVRGAIAGQEDAEHIADRVLGAVGTLPPGPSDETAWAIRRFLEILARKRPLVVCFEDIHWAEPTFLDLVEYLAGWSRGAPILILCLARPDLLERRPSWSVPRANSSVLTLEPLSDAESDALVERLRGTTELTGRVRRRIAEAAEGNPLFVEQMVAMASETGAADGELAVPPTIQALIAERLDRLGTEERAVIERAAVIGREFVRGAVLELAPPDLRLEVGPRLLELVRKELIRPEPSSYAREDGFRFRHVLIRDAAYEGMPKEVRAELHERHAGWLRDHSSDRSNELEEIVGYHLEQAYRLRAQLGPLDPRGRELGAAASDVLGGAGRRALARGDGPAAVNLLERAAALVESDRGARLSLLRDLGTGLSATGAFARAGAVLAEAIQGAQELGDPVLEAFARIEQSVVRLRAEGDTAELVRVAEQAIPVFEACGDAVGLSRAWHLVSIQHFLRCEYRAMESALERSISYAREAGDVREERRSLARLAIALTLGPTGAAEALDRCREIRDRARGDRGLHALVGAAMAELEAMQGRFDEARRLYVASNEVIADLGDRFLLSQVPLYAGPAELLAGDPAAAERELRSAQDTLQDVGDRSALATVTAFLARAVLAQERIDEAGELTRVCEQHASAEDVLAQVVWRGTRARVLVRRGESSAAARFAEEGVQLASTTDSPNLQGDALMDLAEARALAGARVPELVREAAQLYEAKGNLVAAGRARIVLAGRESQTSAREPSTRGA